MAQGIALLQAEQALKIMGLIPFDPKALHQAQDKRYGPWLWMTRR